MKHAREYLIMALLFLLNVVQYSDEQKTFTLIHAIPKPQTSTHPRPSSNIFQGTMPSQYKVMTALIPATSHSEGPIDRVDLEIQPPPIAPSRARTNAINLLLRLPLFFNPVKRCSSLIRSHTKLVITTVGTSPTPRPRLLT